MQILYTHIPTQASTYQTQNTVRIIFEIHKNQDGMEVEEGGSWKKLWVVVAERWNECGKCCWFCV